MMNVDMELDASGLSCPLPILKTRKMLSTMKSGQVLKVISSDQGSLKDIPAFVSQTGDELLSLTEENDRYVFLLRKN
jgi:tRNA 2-thiouridine synthesizing protein A